MPIDLQPIINSPFGVSLASALGWGLPPWLGYPIADWIADRIAGRLDSKVVRAVRLNQWVARGESLEKAALDLAVQKTFRHSARSIYDLYHFIQKPQALERLVLLDPTIQHLTQRPEFEPRGLMIVGLHLSHFDLVLQWMGKQGLRPLVLTIPDPQGGRRLEYIMRKKTGMNLLPASVAALRQALRYLQQGGVVVTGIDRPIPQPEFRPLFFGRPASLPLHHIFLAIKARVPVRIIITRLRSDGKCQVAASDLIEMDTHFYDETNALRNAEKVLYIAESFIRQAPEQWSVSLPVWPEILDQVP